MNIYEYINNPQNYKPTRKKLYTIWACLPPVGTKVYNNLEKADYVTSFDQMVVFSGTMGEQWVSDIRTLAETYTFANGREISPENIRRICDSQMNVGWFKVDTKANGTPMCACFVPLKYQFTVQTSWGALLKGNDPSVCHGKGDFVVCPMVNGSPNFQNRWIVNGLIFSTTYNNRGFTDNIVKTANAKAPIPTPLFKGGDRI